MKDTAGEVGFVLFALQHCQIGERTTGLSIVHEVNHLLQFLRLPSYNLKLEEGVWIQASSPTAERFGLCSNAMTQDFNLLLNGFSDALSDSEHSSSLYLQKLWVRVSDLFLFPSLLESFQHRVFELVQATT